MQRIDFPIDDSYGTFPRPKAGVKCPICKKRKVFEPHSFAVCNFGVLQKVAKDTYQMLDNDNYDKSCFLSFTWHGAHSGGTGLYPDIGVNVDILDSSSSQGDLYFCSISCMRKFFEKAFNKLETLVKRKAKKNRRIKK